MSATEHKASITWVLGIVIAIGGALATWDRLGWITIPAYAQDHEGASIEQNQKAILTLLESQNSTLDLLKVAQARNQDQWECDETDEELGDLEISLAKVSTATEKANLTRQKTKLIGVWTKKDCDRFTD